jgi:hypothetical protein
MKDTIKFPLLVILILAAIVATTSTSAAIVPRHGPSASGAGLFRYLNPQNERTEIWSFSFAATANQNGQTRGRAEFHNLTAQTQVIVRINCLSVSSGFNLLDAAMSGIVLHSDDPNLPKSETVVFAAFDGPFLPNSNSAITPLFPLPPWPGAHDCHDTQPLTILDVEDGDIQIQLP